MTFQGNAALTQLPIRPDWLAARREEVLEPDLAIIDAHQHLWDPPGARYLFDELLADIGSGHRIVATVYAQCRAMYRAQGPEATRPVGETEFAAGVAAMSESGAYGETRLCAGIIGSVDFALGDDVAPVLEAHVEAGGGRFRGIRGRTSWDASDEVHKLPTPPGVLLEDATRRAVARIQAAGLILDIWVFHTQLDEALDLIDRFPDLPVVVNHMGGPLGIGPYRGQRDVVFDTWARRIAALAERPNTFMKIGGLGMRFTGADFHLSPQPPGSQQIADHWRPHVETCIAAFGASRCMFESNFPVDKAMIAYPVLWNAFKRLTEGLDVADRTRLFSGTAAEVYRLEF